MSCLRYSPSGPLPDTIVHSHTAQVPQGATPRTMVVHLLGALTRSVKPGDAVTLTGIFLPEPFTGFRAARAGLLTNTYLLAQSVSLDKRSYQALAITDEQRELIAVRLCQGVGFTD